MVSLITLIGWMRRDSFCSQRKAYVHPEGDMFGDKMDKMVVMG